MRALLPIPSIALAALLAGCGGGGDTAGNTAQATQAPAEPATGVTRDVATPEAAAPVQPMAAANVIQSQPGPDGAQLDLLKVAVTGDILTVTLRCSSEQAINSESFRISDISVIDDATAQRISVLKDNDGKWLASNVAGTSLMTDCTRKPGILWMKFPAPPATSKTISLNLPEVAPFDGVPVTR